MLQDADPSGEGHLRMPDGFPYAVEVKEGYWDGPYSYLDEEGNYVKTSKGYKLDVWFMNPEAFVERHFNMHDPNNWENIKSKIKCDFGNYAIESQRKEREENLIRTFKEEFDSLYDVYDRLFKKTLEEMKDKAMKGWTWFQDKRVDNPEGNDKDWMHHYYTWKVYDENGKEQGSNVHNTESPYKSGLWSRFDNGVKKGYYQWIYKELEEEIKNQRQEIKRQEIKGEKKSFISKFFNNN